MDWQDQITSMFEEGFLDKESMGVFSIQYEIETGDASLRNIEFEELMAISNINSRSRSKSCSDSRSWLSSRSRLLSL